MTRMVKCVICGESRDFADEDGGISLFCTGVGRMFLCDDCVAEIVTAELERRWRDGKL